MTDCETEPLDYFQGDELPVWKGHVLLDGEAPDLSAGWMFTVTLTRGNLPDVVVTSGITGTIDGWFIVAWPPGSLNIAPGRWLGQITGRRDDGAEFTFSQNLNIKPRALAEV